MDSMASIMDFSSVYAWITKPYHVVASLYAMIPFLMQNSVFKAQPRVLKFMLELRKQADTDKLPVGAAGFCWGGHHVVMLCHGAESSTGLSAPGETRSLIDVGFTAHPSFLKIPQDLEGIKLPLSIAWGEHDMQVKLPQVKVAEATLAKNEGVDTEVKIYKGAGHGFGVSFITFIAFRFLNCMYRLEQIYPRIQTRKKLPKKQKIKQSTFSRNTLQQSSFEVTG
jgi:pimeloyl-ACP methyl ester carboxylesterase